MAHLAMRPGFPGEGADLGPKLPNDYISGDVSAARVPPRSGR